MERIKLEIDRSKWYRGQGPHGSLLLRNDGRMCCLGFLGEKLGATKKDLLGMYYPRDLPAVKWPNMSEADGYTSDREGEREGLIYGALAYFNDHQQSMANAEHEAKIAGLMAKIGVDVEFVG